jgi:hypothetical protein
MIWGTALDPDGVAKVMVNDKVAELSTRMVAPASAVRRSGLAATFSDADADTDHSIAQATDAVAWSVMVPLHQGDNEIEVAVEDTAAGNISERAAVHRLRKDHPGDPSGHGGDHCRSQCRDARQSARDMNGEEDVLGGDESLKQVRYDDARDRLLVMGDHLISFDLATATLVCGVAFPWIATRVVLAARTALHDQLIGTTLGTLVSVDVPSREIVIISK